MLIDLSVHSDLQVHSILPFSGNYTQQTGYDSDNHVCTLQPWALNIVESLKVNQSDSPFQNLELIPTEIVHRNPLALTRALSEEVVNLQLVRCPKLP